MEKVQKRLETNFISYHGCGIYRLDGSNVLITKDFPCSNPFSRCFWMDARDATNIIVTRSKNKKRITKNPYHKNYYFKLDAAIRNYNSYYSDSESTNSESTDDMSNISSVSNLSYQNLVIDTDQENNDQQTNQATK